jgi:hypothetical protein
MLTTCSVSLQISTPLGECVPACPAIGAEGRSAQDRRALSAQCRKDQHPEERPDDEPRSPPLDDARLVHRVEDARVERGPE